MENLRYLLVAMAAITLLMSVVSGVNPNYFAGINAFADHDDDEAEDDDNGGTNDDHEEDEQDDSSGKDEHGLVQSLGNHSKATLETDEGAELEVEIEDGDLDDGTYDVMFACDSPDLNKEFPDSLNVTEGQGESELELALSNGTYAGCEVEIDELSAAFPSFNVIPDEGHEEEDDEEDEEENEGIDDDRNNNNSTRGANRHNDDEEEDDDNSASGSHNEGSTEDKRKERKERIVNTTSGIEVHERHRSANPHSPGEYSPGWNYTLDANGTMTLASDSESLLNDEEITMDVEMSVWKSNSAIILFDVVGGTVETNDGDYTVRIGYAIYSLQHDAMKVVALATDDDGNVYSLRLRGSATDEGAQFPMESGSIDLLFGGNVDQSSNRFEGSAMVLEGTVEAS